VKSIKLPKQHLKILLASTLQPQKLIYQFRANTKTHLNQTGIGTIWKLISLIYTTIPPLAMIFRSSLLATLTLTFAKENKGTIPGP